MKYHELLQISVFFKTKKSTLLKSIYFRLLKHQLNKK